MMTIHLTASGSVEQIAKWGHGRSTPVSAERPCTILCDDGDGRYDAWKYSGSLKDAVATLAPLMINPRSDGQVVLKDGNALVLRLISNLDDFWVGVGEPDENGNYDAYEPNVVKYPNAVAW